MNNHTQMHGKVVLVTGSAGGLGLATARAFGQAGATVAIADLELDAARAAADSLAADGITAHAFALDVRLETGWERMLSELDLHCGRLDVLVNNAGVGRSAPLVETSLADWRFVTAVNLDGVFLGIKYGIGAISRQGGGAIVNVASILGTVGTVNNAAYVAAKGGVRQLSKAAALECAAAGNGIRVNCVLPGYVEMPRAPAKQMSAERREQLLGMTPMARFATPAEIADAIVYLASPQSSYITGTDLIVDGGYTAL